MTDRAFVSAAARRSCLVIRLRPSSDRRCTGIQDAQHHRRVQPGMSGDQSEEQAQFDGCDRCPDGIIHHPGCSSLHPLRQWSGVHRLSRQAMDQGCWRRDSLYRTRVTLGKRLLRKFQCPFQGRTLEWGDILYPKRSSIRDRAVVTALQYETATFSPKIQTTRIRKHHPHEAKTSNALTF